MPSLRSLRQLASTLIRQLRSAKLFAHCPCCEESIALKDAELFFLDEFGPEAEEVYQGLVEELKMRRRSLRERRKQIPQRSEVGAEATNIGFILERLAPTLPAFPFDRSECRALFDPIDYLIFEGMQSTGRVDHITFVDIKTGRSRLTSKQRAIKNLVVNKQVEWQTYGGKPL